MAIPRRRNLETPETAPMEVESGRRRTLSAKQLIPIAIALVVTAGVAACGGEDRMASADERGTNAVRFCAGHGGVSAIEDDVVICRDRFATEGRGSSAAQLCDDHGGIVAFDDNVAICRDQSIENPEE
jgi:hypothetical protein